MKFLKKIAVFLSFFIWQITVEAQVYHFENYGLKEGLTQLSANSFEQDSKGYLWIGTDGGVSIFDGINFKDFSTKEGLSNNRVQSIHKDKFDNILVATSKGITVVSRGENIQYKHYINMKHGLVDEEVQLISSDQEQNIIIATRGVLYRLKYDEDNIFKNDTVKNLKFEKINFPDSISSAFVYTILNDKKHKRYWVGTTKGLLEYDKNFSLVQHYNVKSGLAHNVIRTICFDPIDRLWIGTDKGISIFDFEKNIFITKDSIAQRPLGAIHNLYVDSKNRMWCSAPATCILKWYNEKNTFEFSEYMGFFQGSETKNSDLFFEDRENNMWLGGTGIAKFRNKKFEMYTNNQGLSSNSVRGVEEGKNGDLWIGTSSFLQKMKNDVDMTQKGGANFFEDYHLNKNLPHSSIWGLLADSKNNIWFSGSAGGVWKLKDEKGERISDRTEFDGRVAMSFYEDRFGKIWIGTYTLVNVYDPKTDEIYQPFGESDELKDKRGYAFVEDLNDNFWISHQGGLTRIDKNGNRTKFTTENGLANEFTLIMIVDKKGNLWLATGSGISMFDGNKFTHYSTKDFLSSDTPYLLQFDNDGNLWVGTNKGVDKLFLNDKAEVVGVKHYGKNQGFLGIETNARASCLDKNGDLWFGTQGGLVKYNANEDEDSNEPPIVDVYALSINLEKESMIDNLILNYNQNHVSFDFQAVTFTNSSDVKYKFRLGGLGDEWSKPTDKSHISYSNLEAGSYIFEVIASNNNKIWSKPIGYSFTITPPFWKTWWFYLLVIVSLVLMVYTYIKLKTKKLIDSKRILEEKVDERTEELKAANESIGTQRDKLEQFNNDILDSIKYAERIQTAILPKDEKLKSFFPESFVYYLPKDIVGGDFYWLKNINDKLFFAVVDCTGHGVPGGFMSMISYNSLNRAISEFSISKPSEILDFMNKAIPESMNTKIGKDFKDGMDICLCSYNIKKRELEYAGIFNSLWIVSSKESMMVNDNEIAPILKDNKLNFYEIKADRYPIGYTHNSFINHIIKLNEGDIVYLFTDGFADQFGSSRNKKYSSKRLKKLLLANAYLPIEEQNTLLQNEFHTWMNAGKEYQIDDVCIMGIKIQ